MELGRGEAAAILGVLLAKQGKTDEAERAYRTGMELGDGGAAVGLGGLLAEQGKIDNATEAFCTAFDFAGCRP